MWTENILFSAFYWVIPRHLNFICQSFGTLCLFHLHRRVSMKNFFILTRLWRWNRVFRNVGIQNSDAGELPRRKHTAFRTRRKFEIKKISCPAVNPHSIPSGWFRHGRMPYNVTVRQASPFVKRTRKDCQQEGWKEKGVYFRTQLQIRFAERRGLMVCKSTSYFGSPETSQPLWSFSWFSFVSSNKCLLVPQIKPLSFLICLSNSLFTTFLYTALLKALVDKPVSMIMTGIDDTVI
jgi:hypothetical protein